MSTKSSNPDTARSSVKAQDGTETGEEAVDEDDLSIKAQDLDSYMEELELSEPTNRDGKDTDLDEEEQQAGEETEDENIKKKEGSDEDKEEGEEDEDEDYDENYEGMEEETEEDTDLGEDYFLEYQDLTGAGDTFRVLDSKNIPDLINMMSKVRLVWPENMPNYNEKTYPEDPSKRQYPESFYRCSPKEKAVMWHAENFRKQFAHIYPERRPLLIAPRNECDTQKLFPTYINPTVLGYPEFYDAESTAKFMKDFFRPQFLKPPTRMPKRIKSHVTLFKDRDATSYEICTVLVSILNGSGYDSYVVDGYATKEITTMCEREDYMDIEEERGVQETDFFIDPKAPPEPVVTPKDSEVLDDKEDEFFLFGSPDDDASSRPPSPSKYKIKPAKVFTSEYEREMEKRAEQKAEDERLQAEQEALEEAQKNYRPPTPDPLYGFRPHAWVLVKKGARGVDSHFFLEPFSGLRKEITDPNYLGIEAMFNERNYYANIQDCSSGIADISFDLNDKSKWAKLLLEPPCRRKCEKGDSEEENEEEEDFERYDFGNEDEDEEAPPCEKFLDMPVSWTPPLDMTEADYERRYPGGSKTKEYNDAFVETAAPWANADGMIKKVIKFEGRTRDPKKLVFIEEQFAHRQDRLSKRKWFKESRDLHEYFEKGRKDCLKEHVHQSGKNSPEDPRHLYYYSDMHPQNVSHREVIKDGLIEEFEDRDDLLYYREISYGGYLCHTIPDKSDENKARTLLDLMRGEDRGNANKPRKKILKIVEKYYRNEVIDNPDRDIAEKYLLLSEGRIIVNFHYGDENFTRRSLEFFKPRGVDFESVDFRPEDCFEYRVDPFSPYSTNYERLVILKMLSKDELRASSAARQAEDDIYQTVSRRVQEDWSHKMEPNPYAQADGATTASQNAENEDGEDLTGIDFATPYLEKYGVPTTKQEEIALKKKIVLDARNRIIKKARTIQNQYNQISAALKLKMDWYDKVKDSLSQADEEQFQAYYKEELFKMHIMERRLVRHREKAPNDFNKLLLDVLRHPLLNLFASKKLTKEEKTRRRAEAAAQEEQQKKEAEMAKLPKDICCDYRFRFDASKRAESIKTADG